VEKRTFELRVALALNELVSGESDANRSTPVWQLGTQDAQGR
jgi:hypothetical protein